MMVMQRDQEKFQAEMRELVTGLQKTAAPKQTVMIQVQDEAETSEKRGVYEEDDDGRVFDKGKGWRYRKMEMPLFEGKDPDGWVLKSEKYFTVCRLSEHEKVDAAVVAMEGDALKWYQWENGRNPVSSWLDFKARILHQFRPLNAGSLHEQWLATTQTSTVLEYRRFFIEMASPLTDIPESLLMGQFIN